MNAVTEHSPSYESGFRAGAPYAKETASHRLSDGRVSAAAHALYVQASRSITVEQEDFEEGWKAGYQAYFDGII